MNTIASAKKANSMMSSMSRSAAFVSAFVGSSSSSVLGEQRDASSAEIPAAAVRAPGGAPHREHDGFAPVAQSAEKIAESVAEKLKESLASLGCRAADAAPGYVGILFAPYWLLNDFTVF